MEILRNSIANNSKIKDPIEKTQKVIQNCIRPNMALLMKGKISHFWVLIIRANHLRRRGREKRRREGERRKKEEGRRKREGKAKV